MPWLHAFFRGQKVWARVNPDGSFVEQGGRVEIRFKPNDGRAYQAARANLKPVPGANVHDDDHCVAGEFVARERVNGEPSAARSGSTGGAAKPSSESKPVAPSKDDWVAYTDGACSGNPGPAGAGLIVISPGGALHEGFEYLGTATNNIAELTAILRAIEAVPSTAAGAVIHTDSQYSIGVLSKGWKPKANQELIATIKQALASRRRVRLVYVPGHAGVPMNERADELAREAIRVRKHQPIVVAGERA